MSTVGPPEDGDTDLGAARWEVEQDQIDRIAEEDRRTHEVERIHGYEAAEEGRPVAKRPWWKFWGPR